MIQKLAIISSLLMSSSCMVIPQNPHPIGYPIIYTIPEVDPSYNFAYEVNDFATGDIKSQSESRIGGTVLGQYTLVQPDGVIRNVEYRADDRNGFQATVNNIGAPVRLAINTINHADEASRQVNARTQTTEEPKIENEVAPEQTESKMTSTTEAASRYNPWP